VRDTSPKDPASGALHRILREHLASYLADERPPAFVEKELRGYLECGTFARGCAHYRCESCGLDRVAALSCHGRGFCPRCGGRRMTEQALDLCERVLPHERIRQWVLSFPFALRMRLAFHHDLVLALAKITRQEIERRYRKLARAAGLSEPREGSVTVVQRFGSDLRLNLSRVKARQPTTAPRRAVSARTSARAASSEPATTKSGAEASASPRNCRARSPIVTGST
jgi:hypothetical protein